MKNAKHIQQSWKNFIVNTHILTILILLLTFLSQIHPSIHQVILFFDAFPSKLQRSVYCLLNTSAYMSLIKDQYLYKFFTFGVKFHKMCIFAELWRMHTPLNPNPYQDRKHYHPLKVSSSPQVNPMFIPPPRTSVIFNPLFLRTAFGTICKSLVWRVNLRKIMFKKDNHFNYKIFKEGIFLKLNLICWHM